MSDTRVQVLSMPKAIPEPKQINAAEPRSTANSAPVALQKVDAATARDTTVPSANIQTSQKIGAARYYLVTANTTEAHFRNKWYSGSEAYPSSRTHGRTPRNSYRMARVAMT